MAEEIDGPQVYDTGDGIRLEIPFGDGIGYFIDMSDESATELISIIQNKLNARLP